MGGTWEPLEVPKPSCRVRELSAILSRSAQHPLQAGSREVCTFTRLWPWERWSRAGRAFYENIIKHFKMATTEALNQAGDPSQSGAHSAGWEAWGVGRGSERGSALLRTSCPLARGLPVTYSWGVRGKHIFNFCDSIFRAE